ncbi:YhbY family RNA-binding protein [Halioxenophilus aromaticivorans]|uniref:Ribosome assembly RNA-binding protein YhbY n=1 Tax=Halioxenophilus aromaticivorans TaxID=1306992 RepID=A0AAV3U9U0_9ALTE
MSTANDTKKRLRTIGHQLKPCVTIAGNGLSESVLDEVFRALRDHELIKIKLAIPDREARKAIIAELVDSTGAEVVQEIGKVVLIFKKAGRPDPKKTNLRFMP